MSDLNDDINDVGLPKEKSPAIWGPNCERVLSWLRARERGVLLAAVAFQCLFLASMISGKTTTLLTGDVILLRVVPVDPRDLFRGDYVILGYDISRVPQGGILGLPYPFTMANASDWKGRPVFVTLEPDADGLHYHGAGVSIDPPPPGVRFIRGTIEQPFRITFGIESYYVQEGKGKDYEDAIRERRLSAEIALTGGGQAALRGLRIE